MASFRRWQILKRASIKAGALLPLLPVNAPILDIGSGNGGLVYLLRKSGRNITASDVVNRSRFPSVEPLLIANNYIPYPENHFDTVLLITVLHHTVDQTAIIAEAKRLATRQVIIMEDIYFNTFQRLLTYAMDSLVNGEWRGHPHTNRTDREWRKVFDTMGLQVSDAHYMRTLGFFSQVIYQLSV